jgi:hypothetical protein
MCTVVTGALQHSAEQDRPSICFLLRAKIKQAGDRKALTVMESSVLLPWWWTEPSWCGPRV